MKKEDPFRVKAEQHKERLTRVQQVEKELESPKEKNTLPSRSSIHTGKKRKWKTPIISILALLFILLPISILGINSLLKSNGLPTLLPSEATSGFFEQVSITEESETSNLKKNPPEEEEQEQEQIIENVEENTLSKDLPSSENSDKLTEEKETLPEDQQIDSEVIDNSSAEGKIIYHQVKKGETLFEIALKYFPAGNGMEKIKAANNLKTNEIQAGQTLKIVGN